MRRLANSISTTETLKQAFLSCLNKQEYEDITIAELSRRVGINRTTFYFFFGSKDELFTELCNAVVERWFQPFFDLNITKMSRTENVDMEKELFHELLTWLMQWRPALQRMTNVRTESFDGFTLFISAFEKKMTAQSIFATEDEMKRKKYSLFIKVYAVGLASILKWWLDEGDGFEANEFHAMIERLRYKGYYSILCDD